LHKEKDVELLEEDGLQTEEVGRHQSLRMCGKDLLPGQV
jgi:hypothetical protein